MAACGAALMVGGLARGSVIYDESISGDLSNSGLAPTALIVALGSNEVFGTTGKNANTLIIDRDYFTFAVPQGMLLAGITVLPGTQTLGPLGDSFIGMEAGPRVTVLTSATTAAGLLGWDHYDTGDIGNNILPDMGAAGLGATGFTSPLPAGTYSFWVQEASVGTVSYGFDFTVTAAPEPKSWTMLLAGLALMVLHVSRRVVMRSGRDLISGR
jgi:hypothetical protein